MCRAHPAPDLPRREPGRPAPLIVMATTVQRRKVSRSYHQTHIQADPGKSVGVAEWLSNREPRYHCTVVALGHIRLFVDV